MSVLVLLTVGAACLGGCGTSSGNPSFANVGAAQSSGAGEADAAAPSDASAFAPTAAAGAHLTAAADADKFTSAASPGNNAYTIGPLDVLDVQVFNVPDLTRTVQVSDTGTISYPLIGEVRAAGKTAHQVERDLAAKLGAKYLRSPQVTVMIKDYNSQRVTVTGSVKNTGVYALKGNTTLMQVLAMAGDVDATIASGDIVIFRTIDGKKSAARFDIDELKKGAQQDPVLDPGDVVVVDTSATKVALANVLKVLPLATSAAIFVPMM